MMLPVRVTAPAAMPVTLADAKAHLRVDFDDDDAVITHLIETATAYLDGYGGALGRAIITQTWEQEAGWYAGDGFPLEVGPIRSVASVSVVDEDDAEVEAIDLGLYRLDAARGVFLPRVGTSAPSVGEGQRLVIRYVAGYGAAPEDVPPPIRHAILLLVGAWYENREEIVVGVNTASLPEPVGFRALLSPIRGIPL